MLNLDKPKEPENHEEMIGLFQNAIGIQEGIRDNAINCIERYEECIRQTREQQMREEAANGNVIDLEVVNG